ncbi:hypothetical protein IWQ61_004036 [Dispira simplex]|nr:hypothetical protein IWQ61_004036 [Dispira simplex]
MLQRARSLVTREAKNSQIRLKSRFGRYRTAQQLYQAATELVNTHELYLREAKIWGFRECRRQGKLLEVRDRDTQMRGHYLVRLIRLARSSRLRAVLVTLPEFSRAPGDKDPFRYGLEPRVEVNFDLDPHEELDQAVMAVLHERYYLPL